MLSRDGTIPSEVSVETVPQLFFTEVGIYDPDDKDTNHSYFTLSDDDSLKEAKIDSSFADKPTHFRNISDYHIRGIDEAIHFPLIVSKETSLPFLVACDFLYQSYTLDAPAKETATTSTTRPHARQLVHMLNFFYNKRDEFNYLNFKFPIERLRPAYKYWQHLRKEIIDGKMSAETARLHQSTSTSFFKYLQKIELIDPKAELWREETINVQFNNSLRGKVNKQISRPVQGIKKARNNTPLSFDYIQDGEPLRPLNDAEQKILVTALTEIAPPWFKYLTLVCLLTGARLGTIGTLREKHVEILKKQMASGVPPTPFLNAGYIQTGIQTKHDKTLRIYFPHIAIKYLDRYLSSEVRKKHVKTAEKKGLIFKDKKDQHVFINQYGAHVYWSKFNIHLIKDYIYPKTQAGNCVSNFTSQHLKPAMHLLGYKGDFRFHFSRASFAMNFFKNHYRENMSGPDITDLLERLKELMGHTDIKTTQSYLNHYKSDLNDSPITLANNEFINDLLEGII